MSVFSDQPYSIECRDQAEPYTGKIICHVQDQGKRGSCMEGKQCHSVEFRLVTLGSIFFHKKLGDSDGELTQIVGRKDR